MVYLHLFHGRKKDENLDDWGADGPVFGPLAYVHTTYASDIKFEGVNVTPAGGGELDIIDDMVYYDGMYYGDWSVYTGHDATKTALTPYEYHKSRLNPAGMQHRAHGHGLCGYCGHYGDDCTGVL